MLFDDGAYKPHKLFIGCGTARIVAEVERADSAIVPARPAATGCNGACGTRSLRTSRRGQYQKSSRNQ